MIAGLYVADFGGVIKVGRTGSPSSRMQHLRWVMRRPVVAWVWLGPIAQPAEAEAALVADVRTILRPARGTEWFEAEGAHDFDSCVKLCEAIAERFGYLPSALPARREGARPSAATNRIVAGASSLTALEDGSLMLACRLPSMQPSLSAG